MNRCSEAAVGRLSGGRPGWVVFEPLSQQTGSQLCANGKSYKNLRHNAKGRAATRNCTVACCAHCTVRAYLVADHPELTIKCLIYAESAERKFL